MAKETIKWTEARIAGLLAKRYPGPAYAFLTGLRNGTGFKRDKVRTADAVAVSCYPSRGLFMVGIEIKCSRPDWRKELADPSKAESIQRFCKHWFVAAPKGIIQESEVPETWGLIECQKNRTVVTKDAPKLATEDPDMLLVCSILRNIAEGCVPRAELNALVEERAESLSNYKTQGVSNKLEDLQDMVKRFEEESGVKIREQWRSGDIGGAVKIVREYGVDLAFTTAERLAKTYETQAKMIRQSLEKVNPNP